LFCDQKSTQLNYYEMGLPLKRKRLLIRLSSLGDVVLSMAALSVNADAETHFLTASEYATLVEGHPGVSQVWSYNRKTGLGGWYKLFQELRQAGFTEVVDLHRTLRTRVLLCWWTLPAKWSGEYPRPKWVVLNKQRWKLWCYMVFKKWWPMRLRPEPFVRRYAHAAGGTGEERPALPHLRLSTRPGWLPQVSYYAVMPSSLWEGKQWPVAKFVETIEKIGSRGVPVILGASGDQASSELEKILKSRGIQYVSGVQKWTLKEVAQALCFADYYLGNDTGLMHLAEALGRPAYGIFGPTVSDMGFGPWRKESKVLGLDLWCRPCGKDGRNCFRIGADRFACLRHLDSSAVLEAISPRSQADKANRGRT